MSDGAFSRRGAAILAGVAAASLAAAGFLGVYGDALYDPPSPAPDAFSRSAVGHHAAVELLRRMGWQVVVSRHRTADRVRDGAVLALLEPRIGPEDGARTYALEAMDAASRRLLVVLPKRRAVAEPGRPRFVAMAERLPAEDAQRVLDVLELDAKVVRPPRSVSAWRGELPVPAIDEPQLVASERLAPLLSTSEGMLVGELDGGDWRTIVLADPDVLATHGLGRGANATLVVRLLERLGAGERTVVVDETLHGHEEQPSLARALLRFPLVLATASAVLAAALLAWAAAVRFGRPRPPDPVLAPGKLFLVDQTAALLRHGGRAGDAAASYLRAAKDEVVHRLRPPGERGAGEAWLARAEAARGAEGALAALEERARRLAGRRIGGEEEAIRLARDIHAWREEMTDGARTDPRHHRRAQG
ncbi:MAG TPA: DUF4350 domain-containing protein [Anaeromyxobacter sp.]|nr:DUF4350 domain-containing protein [Anaeromyxobacter sp.]